MFTLSGQNFARVPVRRIRHRSTVVRKLHFTPHTSGWYKSPLNKRRIFYSRYDSRGPQSQPAASKFHLHYQQGEWRLLSLYSWCACEFICVLIQCFYFVLTIWWTSATLDSKCTLTLYEYICVLVLAISGIAILEDFRNARVVVVFMREAYLTGISYCQAQFNTIHTFFCGMVKIVNQFMK